LEALVKAILEKENIKIPMDKEIYSKVLSIKSGFPPRPLDFSNPSFTLKNNDSFIVEVNLAEIPVTAAAEVIKVPSDGACLFNAINFAIGTGDGHSDEARNTVATFILAEPVKYNKSFLGGQLEPDEYAKWICKPT
jgi:ubiquitin thioesterase OTU1